MSVLFLLKALVFLLAEAADLLEIKIVFGIRAGPFAPLPDQVLLGQVKRHQLPRGQPFAQPRANLLNCFLARAAGGLEFRQSDHLRGELTGRLRTDRDELADRHVRRWILRLHYDTSRLSW